jgi:single-strand DNA-binding protein
VKGDRAMAQKMGLNRVMVLGFMGGIPELKFTADGKPVAKFSVAVNEKWKDSAGATQERVEWIRIIVSFGRLAEICAEYLYKGRQVFVEGRLQTRGWEDREGQRRTVTEAVASEVKILDSASKNRFGEQEEQTAADVAEDAPF